MQDSIFKYLISPGHDAKQKGKRSPVWPQNNKQLLEYQFTRGIADYLFTLLDSVNIDYENIVPETDKRIRVRKRTRRANKKRKNTDKPTLLISIHGNAYMEDETVSGIETFHYPGSQLGEKAAKNVQNELIKETGWTDRGVKTTKKYLILKKSKMPAILTENGFYTNFDECMKMLDPSWQKRIAYAHYRAIMNIERNVI